MKIALALLHSPVTISDLCGYLAKSPARQENLDWAKSTKRKTPLFWSTALSIAQYQWSLDSFAAAAE
jgi:hypothetical protein